MAQSPRSFPQGFIMPYLPHRGEQARAPRRICRLRRQTGSGTSCRIFCPTGRKQAPSTQIDARSCIPYPPHFLPYRQKTGASVADFRVRRREIILIVFSDVTVVALRLARPPIVPLPRNRLALSATGGASPLSTCVRKNTSQPASVEFARQGRQIMRAAGCIPLKKERLSFRTAFLF